jgi:hypothetical protein
VFKKKKIAPSVRKLVYFILFYFSSFMVVECWSYTSTPTFIKSTACVRFWKRRVEAWCSRRAIALGIAAGGELLQLEFRRSAIAAGCSCVLRLAAAGVLGGAVASILIQFDSAT